MTDQTHPLEKSLHLLRSMADVADGAVGVRVLAAKAGLSPTTTHRTLGALLRSGLVERDGESGKYMLSFNAYRLGLLLSARAPWRELCLPFVRGLTRSTGEASAFSLVDRNRLQMHTVVKLASTNAVTVNVGDGWKSLHAGASGLAILAFLPAKDREEALASHRLTAETDATLVDSPALRRALEDVAAKGYALTRGQRIAGAVGVAAPVFLPGGAVLGSLYVSVPEQRFDSGRESEVVGCVMDSAEAFTQSLRK